MYTYIQSAGLKAFVARETPAIVISLVVAELFYKFGSFSLEVVAFLATWFAISGLFEAVTLLWNRGAQK